MTGRVTIAGGGVAGLSAALALHAHGVRHITVHEQADALREVGAGLQISPNGFAVLRKLGLKEALNACSIGAEAVHLKDGLSGRSVVRLNLLRDAPDLSWRFVHRAALIDLLAAAVRRAGIEIRLGSRVAARDFPTGDGLFIGAEGGRSETRGMLNGDASPPFTGQVAWRLILRDETVPADAQVWMGPGRHLVTYPLPGGLRNIVAVQERAEWTQEGWRHEGDPTQLRRLFSDFAPEVRDWLRHADRVNVWGLFAHPVARTWWQSNRVLVGDAAHPMLPFLAQGANMALEDAWVLASCLAEASDQNAALSAYQTKREARVARVVAGAAANARNYHLSNPILRTAAHGILKLGGRLAPSKALARFDWIYRHDVTQK